MIDYKKDFTDTIEKLFEALSFPLAGKSFEIIDRGVPHKPEKLPANKMGVYIFIYKEEFLKIGKVGPKSNARWQSQHYSPTSSQSNLAKSILKDKQNFKGSDLNEKNIGKWIKDNCHRYDILIDADSSIFSLDFIESALRYKFIPRYEGFDSQR